MKNLVLILSIFFIVSCTSKAKQTPTQQTQAEQAATKEATKEATIKKAEIKTIYLKIARGPNVNSDGAYINAEKELNEAIIKKLRVKIPKANIITTQKPASGIQADVVISEFNYISSPTQMLAAPTSDKAKLGAKLTLTDIVTNKNIRTVEIGTSSKFSDEIFGGTSSAQIDSLAEKIATRIKAR